MFYSSVIRVPFGKEQGWHSQCHRTPQIDFKNHKAKIWENYAVKMHQEWWLVRSHTLRCWVWRNWKWSWFGAFSITTNVPFLCPPWSLRLKQKACLRTWVLIQIQKCNYLLPVLAGFSILKNTLRYLKYLKGPVEAAASGWITVGKPPVILQVTI